MNQQLITDHAEHCDFYVGNEHWDKSYEEQQRLWVEKFAELIVRECVKSALSLRDTAIDNQWTLDETFHVIVDTIVEDFDMQDIFRGN
jgi:hypothetical protein